MKLQWIIAGAIVCSSIVGNKSFANPVAMGMISGGGGKGIVCNGANVELLDLWESRTLFGRTLETQTGDLAKDVDAALGRLKNSFVSQMNGQINHEVYYGQDFLLAELRYNADLLLKPNPLLKKLHGVQLTLTDDSFELARPVDCPVEQLVNYQPDGTILLNADLYEKMDEANQAALIVHEAMYATLRSFFSEHSSIRARRAVGLVFSGETFQLYNPEINKYHAICSSTDDTGLALSRIDFVDETIENRKMVRLIPRRIDGAELMGLQGPSGAIGFNHMTAKNMIRGQCADTDGVGVLEDRLTGPVEYDRRIRLILNCHKSKLEIFLESSSPGQREMKRSKLTCRVGKPKST